jgi:hypothetical protein
VKLCPGCNEPVDPSARFCSDCGHSLVKEKSKEKKPVTSDKDDKKVKIPQKREEKPKEKTVKTPEPHEEEEASPEPEEEFDFSAIDPEKEWECFGQIEPDHAECRGCPYREQCAEKSGVEL